MAERKPFIAGNWKMFKTGTEAAVTASKIANLVDGITEVDIMIAPSFTALSSVSAKISSSRIHLGAQNLFYEDKGAYTGEISASMLKDSGVSHVIIGHSERREIFHETDMDVSKKIKSAIQAQIIPVMCIGETENEKKEEKTFYVLDKQIRNGLKGFRLDELSELIIAYEPVWAIGTGNTATAVEVDSVHRHIRSVIASLFGELFSENIRVIYGGSVKPDNIADLMQHRNIDGALVGGASLEAEVFIKIINYDRIETI